MTKLIIFTYEGGRKAYLPVSSILRWETAAGDTYVYVKDAPRPLAYPGHVADMLVAIVAGRHHETVVQISAVRED